MAPGTAPRATFGALAPGTAPGTAPVPAPDPAPDPAPGLHTCSTYRSCLAEWTESPVFHSRSKYDEAPEATWPHHSPGAA